MRCPGAVEEAWVADFRNVFGLRGLYEKMESLSRTSDVDVTDRIVAFFRRETYALRVRLIALSRKHNREHYELGLRHGAENAKKPQS